MRPIRFKGVEAVLGQPEDWEEDKHGECTGLPVRRVGECIVSCWKPTWKERLTLIFGGGVFLWVVGNSQPPMALAVEFITKE